MGFFDAKQPLVVAVRRNPLYGDVVLRTSANADVLLDAQDFRGYDEGGIAEFIGVRFPSLKDSAREFYCSELIGYYSLKHSRNQMSLSPGGRRDDDVSPYGLQVHPALTTVALQSGRPLTEQVRQMDYVLTTCLDIPGFLIALRTAGIEAFRDRRHVSTHAGILVKAGDAWWVAEMLRDGGPILSGLGKYFPG